MTDKQQIFADEYLKDLNGTRAYKVAYPSVKKDASARANASKLLTNTNIKTYIDEQLEKAHNDRTADAQEVLEYLTAVMRGEETEPSLIGVGEGAQAVIDMGVGAKDRLKAAELLGKRHMLFTDKVDLKATTSVTFVDDVPSDDDD
ncbi:terminase small subunit [Enterococcus sp. CSURQ0835]|uniref:terminase small subunit n=1 Tax=Enterococcus sp. CSURQ0835 TaxID=2681394 RepID=UPI001357557F|nr:terminase small subunit [Enterococcus sp. CSURQ0835]